MSTAYRPEYLPETRDVRDAFADEIATLGGGVPDVYVVDEYLYARGVLPRYVEIRPGDRVQAGVAVRVAGPEIRVHPYTFRQVCTNGAIAADALPSQRLERRERASVFVPTHDAVEALWELRAVVRGCAAKEAFADVAQGLRQASEVEGDVTLHLMSLLSRLPRAMAARALPRISERFTAGRDTSAFGLLNAVTSVARDTPDPETRWRLEELGGTMPALLKPRPRIVPPAALVGA